MRTTYPVIFTRTNDEKNTILIEVPDLAILTQGYGMANAIEMAKDAMKEAILLGSEYKEGKIARFDVNDYKGIFEEAGDSTVLLLSIAE